METGYGYLELAAEEDGPALLTRFVEKLIASGRHLWIARIFLFRADAIIAGYNAHAPQLMCLVQASLDAAKPDLSFLRLAQGL